MKTWLSLKIYQIVFINFWPPESFFQRSLNQRPLFTQLVVHSRKNRENRTSLLPATCFHSCLQQYPYLHTSNPKPATTWILRFLRLTHNQAKMFCAKIFSLRFVCSISSDSPKRLKLSAFSFFGDGNPRQNQQRPFLTRFSDIYTYGYSLETNR